VQFKTPKRIGGLKEYCNKAHFQGVRLNRGADSYCNKEETRLEGPWSYGIRPAQLNKKGDKARKNLELLAMGPEKALEEGHVGLGRQYLDLVKATEMYTLRKAEAKDTAECRGVWVWGAPGTGKSHWARETYPNAFIKSQSKWWDGY